MNRFRMANFTTNAVNAFQRVSNPAQSSNPPPVSWSAPWSIAIILSGLRPYLPRRSKEGGDDPQVLVRRHRREPDPTASGTLMLPFRMVKNYRKGYEGIILQLKPLIMAGLPIHYAVYVVTGTSE